MNQSESNGRSAGPVWSMLAVGLLAIGGVGEARGQFGTGECCLSDSSCTVTTRSDCLFQLGGSFVGTPTCAPDTCAGACCHADGSCALSSVPGCPSPSIFQGFGMACGGVDCAGACCLADGSCEEIGADPCASAGGTYQGLGTACEPVLAGDLDCDGSLLPEWGSGWLDCLGGPEEPIIDAACDEVDLDFDGDVDLGDVALFGLLLGYQACSDVPFPCCGNGIVEAGEQCDDGNNAPGDGCDAGCRTECTPGAPGCGWADGDMVSYGQDSWGGDPTQSTAAALVLAQFDTQYTAGLEVGIPGTAGFSMIFTSGPAVLDYEPGSGIPGSLNADLIDPTSTSSGVFGGHVVALQLDVDFSDRGLIIGASGFRFGDLRLCGLTTTPGYNGMTIRQFVAAMNDALGGGAVAYSFDDVSLLTSDVSFAFEAGVVSLFAQQHLFSGPTCPCTPGAPGCGWADGDMVTYNQDNWGTTSTTAGMALNNFFDAVYPGGGVEIGVNGAGGFSAIFTSATAVFNYQPADGVAGPLDNDLQDPVSTSSGIFGGHVLAVQLDVDFSDAHHLDGAVMLLFGDLRVCDLTVTAGLNGMTVREVLGRLNEALGGASTPYSIDDLAQLAFDLSQSFESGVPSVFAQEHLVSGPACPCTPGAPGCGWADGDMVTYNQDNWGTIGTTASNLLVNYFFTVFTNGYVEIGIPGSGGFSAIFGSADAVIDYQPTTGVPGPLNNDLLDPTSTSSGVFGGHVLALQIDVAFTDAGLVSGTAPLQFGELRVCGLTDTPSLNGSSVRQVLAVMNTAVGGGAAPYSYDLLSTLAEELTESFESGLVSPFARDHLFSGPACPCTPGAPGCGWADGDMVSYNQNSWGGDPTQSTAAALLLANFGVVYPFSAVEVGIPGAAGFSMLFTSAAAILAYQPASGAAAPLNADLLDPTSTSSGVFGGFVLALRLDVDFSDAGYISGTSGLRFGDLRLCGLATPSLNGMTVRDYLNNVANQVLGGATTPYDIDETAQLTRDISEAFEGGAVSPFAQQHLVSGPGCPCTPGAPGCGWEVGDVITHIQAEWGTPPFAAGILLDANYDAVYASTFGIVEIGLAGAAGFSIQFTSASAVFAYQPSSGLPAPLNADLVDPISTASGVFGGEVLALRFNIDFSDVDLTAGSTSLAFGDLTLCNPSGGPSGVSLRAFMDVVNTALGGGSTPYSIDDLNLLTQEINASFRAGAPSLFAQDHLFNGACP